MLIDISEGNPPIKVSVQKTENGVSLGIDHLMITMTNDQFKVLAKRVEFSSMPVLCGLNNPEPVFASDEEYRDFAERFAESIKGDMDKIKEARMKSEYDATNHKIY